MKSKFSADEALAELGREVKALRLRRNLDQQEAVARAGIALNALKRLEAGRGGTVTSLVKLLRALGRDEWLATLAPAVSISPLQVLKGQAVRQRASRKRAVKPQAK